MATILLGKIGKILILIQFLINYNHSKICKWIYKIHKDNLQHFSLSWSVKVTMPNLCKIV